MILRRTVATGAIALLGMILCTSAVFAQLPTPDYSGEFLNRSTLTGDWGGIRQDWANKGITLNANVTQITQGVVDGGKNGAWVYGGRGDLTGVLETDKLGLWPGGFLTAELEGNWTNSVSGKTGALMPANSNQLFPLPSHDNVALPALYYAQFLSHYFGIMAGKVQTGSTGDHNEFAHGKGDSQFFNLAFNLNPVVLTVPYSTLGVGAIVLPTADPEQAIVQFAVFSATGKASEAGFDNINGAVFLTEGRMRTGFFDLTGHQLLGAFYSNKAYTSLDQRLSSIIQDQTITKRDGTWAMYYNFDQFLYETEEGSAKGIGLFGRFGAGQDAPNPAHYFYSLGVGAKGLIPDRANDQFGVGYYYIDVTNPTLQRRRSTISALQDEWGFELYYNLALTPWLLLSPDVQVLGGAQKQQIFSASSRRTVPDATVLGFRLQVIL
ncbi:MAG TPA: carbohydrate porin [Candidatus Acidoferrales bacterium]|nr:carbohydrate porin [Candidatus Acidoferrales bacterium]